MLRNVTKRAMYQIEGSPLPSSLKRQRRIPRSDRYAKLARESQKRHLDALRAGLAQPIDPDDLKPVQRAAVCDNANLRAFRDACREDAEPEAAWPELRDFTFPDDEAW